MEFVLIVPFRGCITIKGFPATIVVPQFVIDRDEGFVAVGTFVDPSDPEKVRSGAKLDIDAYIGGSFRSQSTLPLRMSVIPRYRLRFRVVQLQPISFFAVPSRCRYFFDTFFVFIGKKRYFPFLV